MRTLFFVAALLATPAAFPSNAELTAIMRGVLEPALQAQAGIGFADFGCEAQPPLGPGDRFSCQAVDEEGDTLRYTIELDDEGGASVVRTDQPATSLAPADLATLERPCRAFLKSFSEAEWNELYDALHPSLQSELGSSDGVRIMLESVLALHGELIAADPTWLAVRFSGEQELVYELRSEGGRSEARFGFATDDSGELRLRAFVVSSIPGSPEQERWLEAEGRQVLGPYIGAEIERINAPMAELVRIGDQAEGTAVLADDREILIFVQQIGHRDDFQINDFKFAVLELEFLLERALEEKLEGFQSVSCEVRSIPDGGQTTCSAQVDTGEAQHFTVHRRGGDHRMVPAGS